MTTLKLAIFEDNSFANLNLVKKLNIPETRYEVRDGKYCTDCQTIIHPHYKKNTAECDCNTYNM